MHSGEGACSWPRWMLRAHIETFQCTDIQWLAGMIWRDTIEMFQFTDDQWLAGMIWRDALFIDTALPFGLLSAPKIFTALADAAEWIERRRRVYHSLSG